MRIPDQLLHCRYDVYLTLQVADAIYVVCELSSKHTVPVSPLQHALQLSTLPFTRRSELISKMSAAAGLMGNDHILSLRTEELLAGDSDRCGRSSYPAS